MAVESHDKKLSELLTWVGQELQILFQSSRRSYSSAANVSILRR